MAPGPPVHHDPHPLFLVATLGGEIWADYAAVKLALFATAYPGISVGGTIFIAPWTGFDGCAGADDCSDPLQPVLLRWTADVRLGTPYAEDRHALAWMGIGTGLAYLGGTGVGPTASVAIGGDIRVGPSWWLELSPRLAWEDILAGNPTGLGLAGSYVTLGLDLGLRGDLAH